MSNGEPEPHGRLESWIIARRAKKIRSIRDPEFEIRQSWNEFRNELLARFANSGPVTEQVWQEADEFWRDSVREYLGLMPTKKAENQLVAEYLQNNILGGWQGHG
jgi:hypothetical protein